MIKKQLAWIYCRIDSPEDFRGTLKFQRQQLIDYADQMNLEVAGCSEDIGIMTDSNCPGFKRAVQNIRDQQAQVLLVYQLSGLAANVMKPTLRSLAADGIGIYSPMEGEILLEGFG